MSLFHRKNDFRVKLSTKLQAYILSATLLILAGLVTFITIQTQKMARDDAHKYVQSTANEYANLVSTELNNDMSACRAIAQAFTGYNNIPFAQREKIYNDILKNLLEKNPQFISTWVSWELNDIDPAYKHEHGRIRYTYYKENNEILYKKETLETNTDNVGGIYYNIKANPYELITDPYFFSYSDNNSNQILEASLCVPLMEGKNFIGLIGVDVELERFKAIVENIMPFRSSFAIMVSDAGSFISHPDSNLINTNIKNSGFNEAELDIQDRINSKKAFSVELEISDKQYLVSFAPFEIGNAGQNWYIGVFVPTRVILAEARHNLLFSLISGLAGIIIISVIVWIISRNITIPLRHTTQKLNQMAIGNIDAKDELVVKTHDELAEMAVALNTLNRALNINAEFAIDIGKGNLHKEFNPLGEKDKLGNALLQMRDNLLELRRINDKNNWMQDSIVKVSETLQGEKSTTELANQLLSLIAKILNINIGAIFIGNQDYFALVGSYAYNIRKSNANKFKVGEGMVGQVALEKKFVIFTDIPNDYISIKSGLGETKPRNIILFPLIYQNNVIGIMELGSVSDFDNMHIDFLKQISESIAIAFNSIKVRDEIKSLLYKTQEQAEELKVQQEELREANDELEQQTKALKDSEEQLQQQQEELRVTNEELQEKTRSLEIQKAEITEKNIDLENARNDIERKAMEVETASKYKSEFLANMSHELRTPLNSLLILSGSLAQNREGNLTADQIESAQIIYKSGSDLLNMINDILDLSKIEAGKMTMNFEKVALQDIGETIYHYFKHITEQKGIAFRISYEPKTPLHITTDKQKLEQVLKNFLSNAIKFTSSGEVNVKFHNVDPKADLGRSGLNPSESVAITVSDTGIGIPKDKQLAIFEAFQQADGSTSRNYGGTGLGLSISRELAKLLGGEIQLKSEPGKGSDFTLFLPSGNGLNETGQKKVIEVRRELHENNQLITNPGRDVANPENPKPVKSNNYIPDDRNKIKPGDHCILIIEDDPDFAKILLKECHDKGFSCLAASTGEEGVDLATGYIPQAIVLDIKLPGINGWQVLDLLKENSKTRHIPVHIMSGEDATIDAFRKGAIGYLTKPIDNNQLENAFKKLEEYINRKMSRLLLVEDDPNLRKTVKKLIGESDVEIMEADTGIKTLELLKSNTFDCVVLDLGLPDITGFELIKTIEKEISCKPPIIVYTGKDLTKEEDDELKKYAETVIVKGVKSEERLIDETALFLHRVIDNMPEKQQDIIRKLHSEEEIFKNKKILLVDDDMRNVFALTKVLNDKNMKVLRADNGKTALEILESENNIDLILMDIMMPVMDGYEAIKEIRKLRNFTRVPVIALTAKAMKDDKEKCIRAGANDYMTKPINIEKLLSLMRVWLYK